jgi:glucose uptake protein
LALSTTSLSAEFLLLAAFFLLGLWSSTFKLAGNRWRFELYSFDFAFGAALFALISSYAFGAFGAELGFAEHLMISSKTNQALAFVGGGLFAFGNILLLSGVALLGLSYAYAIATSSALLVLAAVQFSGVRALFLGAAILAALLAIIFEVMGAKSSEQTLPAVSLPIMVRKLPGGRAPSKASVRDNSMRNSTKGTIVSILGGLALGAMVSPFYKSVFGQFGLGAFAGIVLFFAGGLAATLVLGLLLMNIPVHGGPTSFKAYLRGTVGQHFLGLIGGVLCAAGVLSIILLNAFPVEARPDGLWLWLVGLGAGFIAMALGLTKWRELAGAPGSALRSLTIGALFLALAIGAFAFAMDRIVLTPTARESGLAQSQLPG